MPVRIMRQIVVGMVTLIILAGVSGYMLYAVNGVLDELRLRERQEDRSPFLAETATALYLRLTLVTAPTITPTPTPSLVPTAAPTATTTLPATPTTAITLTATAMSTATATETPTTTLGPPSITPIPTNTRRPTRTPALPPEQTATAAP